jgi:succinoglycan biosynthesis protein ExoA
MPNHAVAVNPTAKQRELAASCRSEGDRTLVSTDKPTIAFIVATLNEERAIEPCIRSLLDQRYPADLIEVVVVDGGSTDRTRQVVTALSAIDPRVRLLHNPGRIAASAFNIGVAATTGRLVSLVGAHGISHPDYAMMLADAFANSGAELVGGRSEAEAEPGATPMARAIVRAVSSPLGVGGARYRYSTTPGWVDTAYPGAYRRELFTRIGGFDESLVRNQDDELHHRARMAGHPMWFDPRLRSTYRPRSSLRQLWSQYYQYGWWRAVTVRKHGKVASVSYLVPAALVAGLAAGPVVAAATRRHRRLAVSSWAGAALAWGGVTVLGGWRERSVPADVAIRVPAAIACLHLAYGVGFWSGAAHMAVGRAGEPRRRAQTPPPVPMPLLARSAERRSRCADGVRRLGGRT